MQKYGGEQKTYKLAIIQMLGKYIATNQEVAA